MAGLDDATLVAFVDGELDPAAARDVARLLAEDPAAQEKVRQLRRSAALARAAFAGPEWHEVPPRLVGLVAGPRAGRQAVGRRRLGGLAVAASVAAVAGLAGGMTIRAVLPARRDPATRLMAEVAEYHTVLARESDGLDLLPASARPRIAAWFARVLGRPLAIPDLGGFGLAFRGARLLVVDGRPVTQFLYAAPGDARRPFGICVAAWRGADHPLTIARHDGADLALWASNGFAYVLIGWTGPAELDRIAVAIRPVIEAT